MNDKGESTVSTEYVLVKKKKPIYKRVWFWLLALIVIIVIAVSANGGGSDAETATDGAGSTGNKSAGKLVVEVTSTKSKKASITLVDPTNDNLQMAQFNDEKLPFKKTWSDIDELPFGWNMNAQQQWQGELTCTVTYEGEVVATNTSSGPYSLVDCTPDTSLW